MICIWEIIEQQVCPELDLNQKSKFRNSILGNLSIMPSNHMLLRIASLASWLVHICGLIMYQLHLSVLYTALNFSKRG